MATSFLDFPVFRLPDASAMDSLIRHAGKRRVGLMAETSTHEQEDLDYAAKIVAAVGLSLEEDIHLFVKTPEQKVRLSAWDGLADLEQMLVFGPDPDALGLHVRYRPYQPLRLGKCSWLFADALSQLREERAAGEKRRAASLWKALQELFPQATNP